jgi:hypothetical protein
MTAKITNVLTDEQAAPPSSVVLFLQGHVDRGRKLIARNPVQGHAA